MRAYVINLDRRPDRRADMERQAKTLGLEFEFVRALDARDMATWIALPSGVTARGEWSDGDLACTLSHRGVWQLIAERGEPHAAILEDDLLFSPDTGPFLADDSWIPLGQPVVKLERRGRRERRVLFDARTFPAPAGRELVRFHSRNLGAAAYIISLETAVQLLDATRVLNLPVDHVLFNPALSKVFARFRPLAVEPAICEQRLDEVASDIIPTRHPSFARRLHALRTELVSLPPKMALGVRLGVGLMAGRVRRQRMTFR